MKWYIGGQGYKIRLGINSFDATVNDYKVAFIKDKEQLVIRKNSTVILETDGFFVKSFSPVKIENRGFELVIEGCDFILTYQYIKFIRFRSGNAWIVVEISGGN